MTYQPPELLLIGAAQELVLHGLGGSGDLPDLEQPIGGGVVRGPEEEDDDGATRAEVGTSYQTPELVLVGAAQNLVLIGGDPDAALMDLDWLGGGADDVAGSSTAEQQGTRTRDDTERW